MLELNRLYNMDCMEGMKLIPDKSIDLMLTDPPYNATTCEWDIKIDLTGLWKEWQRIIKDNGTFIITSTQPFTTDLINSNRDYFRYDLIWDKITCSSPALAKLQPLRSHENILIFYKQKSVYNPILNNRTTKVFGKNHSRKSDVSGNLGADYKIEVGYPKTILRFIRPNNITKDKGGLHPSQKPIDLFRYLIKTYSNEGDLVYDGFIGSGTTAIACEMEDRNWIAFEIDKDYYEAALKRIENHKAQLKLTI